MFDHLGIVVADLNRAKSFYSSWRDNHETSRSPIHVAFAANSTSQVDGFHAAGISSDGRDNEPPGDRGRGYYGAYVIDQDGNNVEAGCRNP